MKEIQGKAVLVCEQSEAIKELYTELLELHEVIISEADTPISVRDG